MVREETKRKKPGVEKCLSETGSWLQGDRQRRVPFGDGEQTRLASSSSLLVASQVDRAGGCLKEDGKCAVISPCLFNHS